MSTKFTENRNLFHTFSRVAIQEGQGVAAAVNKTGHTVTTNDVWSDIDKLPKNTAYFGNANTAFDDLKTVYDANVGEFSKYVKLYENAVLSPVDGSGQDLNKNQAWELLVDGKRVKNFVAPTDVFDANGQPCNGYTLKLFDKSGTQIPATDGNWAFDYVAGLVIFERGKTPQDMGWASTASNGVVTPIKITAWAYTGKYLSDSLANLEIAASGKEIAEVTVVLDGGAATPANSGKTITSAVADGVVTMTINAEVLSVKQGTEEIQPDMVYAAGVTTLTANFGELTPPAAGTAWTLTYRI